MTQTPELIATCSARRAATAAAGTSGCHGRHCPPSDACTVLLLLTSHLPPSKVGV